MLFDVQKLLYNKVKSGYLKSRPVQIRALSGICDHLEPSLNLIRLAVSESRYVKGLATLSLQKIVNSVK